MIVPDQAPSAAAVAGHYDELDVAYRRIWGEHVHHGYWETGRESPEEAADALVRLVAQRLAPRPGQQLCDIGCGYGATGAYLARHFGVGVTGLTLSPVQAGVAQARRAPGFQCLRRDWLDNGLGDQSFDHAYAIESSEHRVDKARFFTEAWRVLRPGGRLVVCAWLEGEHPRAWETRHLLKKICSEGQLPSMGSRADYDRLAASAGFAPRGFDDISREVRRTWSICMRRIFTRALTHRAILRLAFSPATRNRSFLLSLPRLWLALGTGAMRYGVFVFEKPETG
jgi:tocopherol O-methyltransferase